MCMHQLFFVGSYFRSNMVTEQAVVTFGEKVGDAFDSFEEVKPKIIEKGTAM